MATLRHPVHNTGDNRRPTVEELFGYYRHRLAKVIYRWYRPWRISIEDVVMETLEDAWRQLDEYDPERGNVMSWLVAIAKHKASNWSRAVGRRHETSYELLAEGALACEGPGADSLRRLRVARAIDNLSERERACVLGVYERCDTVAALMEDLGLSKHQVRHALERGMYRLRRGCRGNGPGSRSDSATDIDRPKRRHKPWARPATEGREDDPPAAASVSQPRR
jgi:RNA polymerase sigma-70 factor (ECF subfamily)